MKFFFDSNVLVYLFDANSPDKCKKTRVGIVGRIQRESNAAGGPKPTSPGKSGCLRALVTLTEAYEAKRFPYIGSIANKPLS
jgi:hypothetical protein